MRMLLTSNGIKHGAMGDALADLLGKPFAESRLVVVIDAILPFADGAPALIDRLVQLQALGWARLDVLSLLGAPRSVVEERLRDADVIYGYGGSNHWLAHAWTVTGLTDLLTELLEQKVYVGHSAGSMIFSRLHAAAVDAFDDQEEVRMLELDAAAPALPVFDWFVMPHLLSRFLPEQTDAWAAAGAARLGGPSWFIDDDTALLVRDPDAAPEVVSTGHWLRFDAAGALVDAR